jgi:hypothetical protein
MGLRRRERLTAAVDRAVRKPPDLSAAAAYGRDMTAFTVQAIDPARLADIRASGQDEEGNSLAASSAAGWEPLRCCLRLHPC